MSANTKELWTDFPALDLVRTSRYVRFAGRLTFTVLILSTIAMFTLPWRQTATGTGTVVALDPQLRPQAVKSPAKGIVKFVMPGLREGSYVKQDDVLLELEPAAEGGIRELDFQLQAVQIKVDMARSRMLNAEQQIETQEASGRFLTISLEQDLMAARKKWEQTQSEVAALESELADKENQEKIAVEVAEQGIISREQLVTKQQASETQRQKVRKAKDAELGAQSELKSKEEVIKSKQQEIELKNRLTQQKFLEEKSKLQTILKELSELTVKKQEFDRLKVTAPRSGFIQEWYGLEGSDNVKEGDQLFVIVPDPDELAVELLINGNDMPLVHVGDQVRLQFEGWPAVQFVGWPSVAVGTFGGEVNRVFPTDDGKGNFRVLVTAANHLARETGWPNENYLRQGVRANGWVLLKRVSLGYEVWRQLNGFPPTVVQPGGSKEKAPKVKLPKA